MKKHIHKFERRILGGRRLSYEFINGKKRKVLVKTGGYTVFKCAIPGCTTYIPAELIDGHESICWTCELPLTINKENMKAKRPIHEGCKRIRIST